MEKERHMLDIMLDKIADIVDDLKTDLVKVKKGRKKQCVSCRKKFRDIIKISNKSREIILALSKKSKKKAVSGDRGGV